MDLPGGDDDLPCHEISFKDAQDDRFVIETEGHLTFTAHTPEAALAALVTAASRLALDEDASRLHLHCAALSLEGRGVLISAPSGTGKTTLAASLVLQEWTYISDEAVALSRSPLHVTGFPKPLMIKPGGGPLLPQLGAHHVSLGTSDSQWWNVPVSRVTRQISEEVDPKLIVILHHGFEGSETMRATPMEIHPADTVVALMEQTMDAQRFGPDAVNVLADLASRCTCVSMAVGPLDQAASALTDLLRAGATGTDVHLIDTSDRSVVDGWRVPEAVRSVLIGDRAVIHDTAEGAIVALDEAGTGVWRALHGDRPHWLSPDGLETNATKLFLAQLCSRGLLTESSAHNETGGV